MLKNRLEHYVDENISDMLRRLDNYSTARAHDLRDAGETWGSTADNVRRFFSRFLKCYFIETLKKWKFGNIRNTSKLSENLVKVTAR